MKINHLKLMFTTDVHNLEYDAATQYKFHFFWAWFWFLVLIAIPFIPQAWGHSTSALIIQEVSLWANFATHFGAMSAALAARQQENKLIKVEGELL